MFGLTGDGIADFVTTYWGGWTVCPGAHSYDETLGVETWAFAGCFAWSLPWPAPASIAIATIYGGTPDIREQLTTSKLADMNGDGLVDLVTSGWEQQVPWVVYLNNGTLTKEDQVKTEPENDTTSWWSYIKQKIMMWKDNSKNNSEDNSEDSEYWRAIKQCKKQQMEIQDILLQEMKE